MIAEHSERRLQPRRRRVLGVGALIAAAACLASCASPAAENPSGSGEVSGAVYVAIGDSYAAGFQPSPNESDAGYAQQIAERSIDSGAPLTLVNFGCPGATSSAVVQDVGCLSVGSVVDGEPYPETTQLAGAMRTLRVNPDRIAMITVSVGGNDIAPCLDSRDPLACARDLAPAIERNLDEILGAMRAEVGPDVPIVGVSYPDVYVRDLASDDPDARTVALVSIDVFRDVLNPALAAAYARAGAGFADITTDSGAYIPAESTVELADGQSVPEAVANVCIYTHFCTLDDLHPTTDGYSFIADRVLAVAATL